MHCQISMHGTFTIIWDTSKRQVVSYLGHEPGSERRVWVGISVVFKLLLGFTGTLAVGLENDNHLVLNIALPFGLSYIATSKYQFDNCQVRTATEQPLLMQAPASIVSHLWKHSNFDDLFMAKILDVCN